MAKLTMAQMEMYAAAAGLPEPRKWAAIGMAESGGRTDVVNAIGCVGIWQINQPVHVKTHPHWTVAWLKDPANNARAAKVIFDAQGWSAWEAYTGPDGQGDDGPWRKHYEGGSGGSAAPVGFLDDLTGGLGDALGAAGDVASEVGRIAQAVARAGNWLSRSENWLRIGYVIGGGVLLGIGVAMVVRQEALKKVAPALGEVAGKKVKAVRAAASSAREDRAREAAETRRSERRVAEAYSKTRARAQARADAKKGGGNG